MDNALKLRVMFDMIDNFTKPLKNVLNSNKGLAQSLKRTRGELAELGKQQKAVASFREMRTGLVGTASKLDGARARVKRLADSLRAFGPPSRDMIDKFEKAKQSAARLSVEHEKQSARVRELRAQLASTGINTRQLAEHERTLRSNIAQTTATMQAQTRQLEAMAEREKKLGAARGKMQALQGVAGGMAIGGYAAKSAGAGVLGGLGGTLDEAKKAQNEIARIQALGLGEQSTRDAEKFARNMKVYGSSYTDNLTMMRDSMTIFADEHHAQMAAPILSQMKFANEAMYGAEHGEENERKFMNMLKVIELRNGTKDEATFRDEANRVQKVISATGGRVGGDQWMEFIQRGGVAAKSLSKDAFFYQMEPIVQEMQGGTAGNALMSGYQNLIEGRTTVRATRKLMKLGLLDAKKVEYDKNGHVKAFADGALLNAEQYKSSPYEWLQKTLLPALAKKGIKGDKAILSAIGSIFTNRSASNLFATMYLQRDQIAKNERLNKGAAGITELDDIAKQQTSGKEIAALAKLKDLKEEIGERVTPIYNAALDKTRELADRLLKAIKEHPEATKAIVVVAAALGGLLAVMGTFTIVLAGLLGPLAIVRFSMTTLGMKGGLLRTVFGGLASLLRGSAVRSFSLASRGARILWRGLHVMSGFMRGAAVRSVIAVARAGLSLGRGLSILASLLRVGLVQGVAMAGRALSMLGRAIMVLGRLALANPLLAFIALLAIAAIYVWQNWDTLGPKFAALWETIKGAFGAAGEWIKSKWDATVEGVKSKLASIGDWFGDIGARFTEIGGHLIDGFVNGIKNGFGAVKDTISSVADSTVAWFKDKLGIHSPSRVFATLGGFVSEGAAVGIESEQRRVANAALHLATVAVASFGAPVLAASATLAKPTAPLVQPTVPIDRRAPLAAPSAASSPAAQASPIVINIYPQAGQDPHAIARAVEAALDRRERAKQSRIGSRLSD
ncbi:phage-encoded membrane protein [Burkholderia pseudomallei]|nr:phage-encoded membrane protein [Burkholderia pseudomallei]